MSIEQNLERIANALEILAEGSVNGAVPDDATVEAEASASGGPKATRKSASKKKGAAKKGAAKKGAAKAKKEPVEDEPTREDVHEALTDFCKEGPGKAAAKDILEEFKAGSISTLDSEDYGAFIARLIEVSGG